MAIEFGQALEEERIVSSTLTHDDVRFKITNENSTSSIC